MMVASITIATGTIMGVVMANAMANAVVAMRGFLLPTAINKDDEQYLSKEGQKREGKAGKRMWTKEEEYLIVTS